ncbi:MULTISPECIES: hypothetical protein [unclassified Tolypothrix]|uniref:hypothetical protein n=1 Tax=unclassified Tolypothrix TaxID=2649714 RepID=UPI0005EAC465|nr:MULTISPECIES: hypothetical protein [unclassified Tolypothrix]BAY93884.1 cell division protein FtsL [Microchaete diplosiphon NIES-3275]EKF03403.1 hypothetical protein FDUTEX481_02528 [Tolypothrix sp. PCC 7601]MBE9082077.1 hypothetical protein [Tolypothrix sp. LEGE 11397]UYD27666.1 hypothetical protein HGR01_06260 [Tolypothrix sp. PCC 7712]UYD36473.1 hypothetical protein HG267_12430 [Tolypothrix sp. PCC 7601]
MSNEPQNYGDMDEKVDYEKVDYTVTKSYGRANSYSALKNSYILVTLAAISIMFMMTVFQALKIRDLETKVTNLETKVTNLETKVTNLEKQLPQNNR